MNLLELWNRSQRSWDLHQFHKSKEANFLDAARARGASDQEINDFLGQLAPPRCDWQVRRAHAGGFVFEPCGRPGRFCDSGPEWQRGAVRCSKHTKS